MVGHKSTINIKPYERINDQSLVEMCINSYIDTSAMDFKHLVISAVHKFGLSTAVLILTIALALYFHCFTAMGAGMALAFALSVALLGVNLYLIYGVILPRYNNRLIIEECRQTVKREFENIPENFNVKDGNCFFLATEKSGDLETTEQIVGCVYVKHYDWKKDPLEICDFKDEVGKLAILDFMTVSAAHRGKGIARKLLEEAKLFCKNHSYDNLVLSCYTNNKPALAMYQKAGFVHLSNQFYGPFFSPEESYNMTFKC